MNAPSHLTIEERLRRAACRSGLNGRDLARATGISASSISRVMRHDKRLSGPSLDRALAWLSNVEANFRDDRSARDAALDDPEPAASDEEAIAAILRAEAAYHRAIEAAEARGIHVRTNTVAQQRPRVAFAARVFLADEGSAFRPRAPEPEGGA